MSTNAILPEVFVGTHSCAYMVQNREDCVGVSSHCPNWAASRVHALMLREGSVRTPGGHFFTFADGPAVHSPQRAMNTVSEVDGTSRALNPTLPPQDGLGT